MALLHNINKKPYIDGQSKMSPLAFIVLADKGHTHSQYYLVYINKKLYWPVNRESSKIFESSFRR